MAAKLLEWARRARTINGELSTRRVFVTVCGRFKIAKVTSKVERDSKGRPVVSWLSIRCDVSNGGEWPLEHHRTQGAAEAMCEAYAASERAKTVDRLAARAGVR